MHITTNLLKMIMSAYHTIKKLVHNIVLKEIQHFVDYLSAISSSQRTEWSLVRLTGMTHCASFSGMEQFGSGSRGTVNCFTPLAIFKIFLESNKNIYYKLIMLFVFESHQIHYSHIFDKNIFIWWNIYKTYKQIFIIIHNTLINF